MPQLTIDRTVDAPAAVVWDVVTDHDLYAAVAPNLRTVEVLEGEGAGLVRRCVDTNGNEWTESCTRWEDGRAFAVAVDVEHSDFHRRLFSRFEGEWRVTPRPEGVRITIQFGFEPRYGPVGVLITKFFAYRGPPMVETILDGWEAEIEPRTRADGTTVASGTHDGDEGPKNALYR